MYEFGMIYAFVSLGLFLLGCFLDYVLDWIEGEYLEMLGFAMLALVGVAWAVLAIVAAFVALVGAVF